MSLATDPAAPAAPADDSSSDRFALIDLEGGPTATAPKADPELEAGRALLVGATTEAALDKAVRALVTRYPDKSHPVRVALRPVYSERLAAIKASTQLAPAAQPAPAPAPATARQAIPVLPEPHRGQFRKYGGEWRGWIAHTGRAVRPGDRVVMERRNGSTTNEYVRTVVNSQYQGGCLIEFGAAPEPAPAPVAAQPAPVQPSTLSTGSLAETLGAVASEAASNASITSAGSLAGGQLAGVGFTSAEGYVTALAHGVKAATAESYKTTLRTRYGYTTEQIAALAVTIIPEAALPVGAGITHGPASSDAGIAMLRQARLSRHGRQQVRELHAQVRQTLGQRTLIAGLITERSLLQWSWVGGGETTRGRVVEALTAIQCADLAPGSPSAVRYTGDAVDAMRSREYDTARLPSNDLPDGIKARWIVGRKLTGSAVAAGASYGETLLVVSLRDDDDSLTFEGDQTLAAAVRNRYNKSTEHETLRSDVLTSWLGKVIRTSFYGVKRGAAWYIPAAMRTEALALCNAIAPLWGDHETITVSSEQDVTRVLANGIREEITKLGREVEAAVLDAQDRAKLRAQKDGTNPENAARAATFTVATAAKLVKLAADVCARFDGYSGVLDTETAAALRVSLTEAQRKIAEYGGDVSIARAAMLEME